MAIDSGRWVHPLHFHLRFFSFDLVPMPVTCPRESRSAPTRIAANEALRNLRHYSELLFMTDGLVVHWMFELACPKLGKH